MPLSFGNLYTSMPDIQSPEERASATDGSSFSGLEAKQDLHALTLTTSSFLPQQQPNAKADEAMHSTVAARDFIEPYQTFRQLGFGQPLQEHDLHSRNKFHPPSAQHSLLCGAVLSSDPNGSSSLSPFFSSGSSFFTVEPQPYLARTVPYHELDPLLQIPPQGYNHAQISPLQTLFPSTAIAASSATNVRNLQVLLGGCPTNHLTSLPTPTSSFYNSNSSSTTTNNNTCSPFFDTNPDSTLLISPLQTIAPQFHTPTSPTLSLPEEDVSAVAKETKSDALAAGKPARRVPLHRPPRPSRAAKDKASTKIEWTESSFSADDPNTNSDNENDDDDDDDEFNETSSCVKNVKRDPTSCSASPSFQGHSRGNHARQRDSSGEQSESDAQQQQNTQQYSKSSSRSSLSKHQKAILKQELDKQAYPSMERMRELGEVCGMNARKVRIWFQNQRAAKKAKGKGVGEKGRGRS
ncbi:hypothetical protein BCR33DRAFT_711639 [Rhizoclosmatium globosum]|uniref:Homeobox domain-containing protein n=1 Tax=Rhizoclosmatium globosum TaxID=329046 RepID=A0A1Y2CZ51_9FUNG|nr:hypothetical protein BCR33DRAFT_711639 [Rhizoclosmatium globosum]|eukprot:ORY52299.1 hypothetical protein BCR33DRAFT_711639 [Rhizoclosmatium globosum]